MNSGKEGKLLNSRDDLLKLNLQLFAEGDGEKGDNEDGSDTKDSSNPNDAKNSKDSDGKGGGSNDNDEPMIPKHRFDEINNALKEAQKQLKEIQDVKKKEEIHNQKKKGEFEKLYNDTNSELETAKGNLEGANSRVEALESVINTLLNQKITGIDENFHDLIPSGMTPEQKLNWLAQAEAKGLFGKNDKSEKPLGKGTNGGDSNANVDLSKLSPLQMLSTAYNSLRK